MELGAVGFPVLPAELKSRLRAIVDGIGKIRLTPLRRIAKEERDCFEQFGSPVIFLAADFQGENAGAGARNSQMGAGMIPEAPRARVLTALDILDGHLNAL